MKKYTAEELKVILDKHSLWVSGNDGGERANLRGANLRGSDLWGIDLRGANLRGANLWEANLWEANLREANLREADLWGANLRGANLREADLRGANLWGVVGNSIDIKSGQFETYPFAYTDKVLQIGCECHDIDAWWCFDDDRILGMDGEKAVKFWTKWKSILKQIIEMSPVESK